MNNIVEAPLLGEAGAAGTEKMTVDRRKALQGCTILVHGGAMRPDDSNKPLPESENTERISVSLSTGQKSELQRIAAEKKVSLAWVIRDAIDVYLGKQASS